MEILSNISGSHHKRIKALIKQGGDRLIITSPFLASDMLDFLKGFDFHSLKSVELVTTFKRQDPEQLTKPKQLLDLQQYFKVHHPSVKVKIHVDNDLHGKTYVLTNQNEHSAIITSANFTHNGLEKNHEWGVYLSHSDQLSNLVDEIFDAIEYSDLTVTQLEEAVEIAKKYQSEKAREVNIPNYKIDILSIVYFSEETPDKEPRYFLKPIGTSDDPVLQKEQTDYSELRQNLHFFQKGPKSVKQGDIVITTGIGCGALLSYFKVTGSLLRVSDEDVTNEPWKGRWPWYVEGRNQSPNFGGAWWKYNIKRSDAVEEFLQCYPQIPVTNSGKFSLGALNYGKDRVQITKEFGEFLISKIENCIK